MIKSNKMSKLLNDDLEHICKKTESLLNEVKGKSIFITGGTGFFGKWILEFFLYLNENTDIKCNISVLTRNPDLFLAQNKQFLVPCIQFIKGDIISFDFDKIPEPHYILHAATDADAKLNVENPLLMLETITEGTKRVLDFARKQPHLKALLLTSSGAVYGKQPESITHIKESDSFFVDINTSIAAYGEGKRLAELYCAIYAKQFNVPVKIARCFAFVGPYLTLDKHFAIGNFILDAMNNQDIIIKGDGTPLRSYMYASDLVIWLLNILVKGECNVPYNVGSDQAISIEELAKLVQTIHTNSNGVQVLGQKSNKAREQYVPDITKAKNDLQLNIEIGLEEAIRKTIAFHQLTTTK
jgi:nucleoside-diphosphate-sugar epimerase